MPETLSVDQRAAPDADAMARSSRRWRSVWRIHFYAGMVAMPFILLMAVTGLVILYTQPIEDATEGDVRTVEVGSAPLSLDDQAAAVEEAYPDALVLSVTPPPTADRATLFGVDDGSANGRNVFVDPYTGEVLGSTKTGGGIVGLSNRLHGFLNNETVMITLPAVAAFWDGGPTMRDYVLGDVVLEVLGVWTLALVLTGLVLWWPRRSRNSRGSKGERRLLGVRTQARGRPLWRDLHALGGVVLAGILAFTIVSGMAWSSYWAETFNAAAERLTPGEPVETPVSELGERGDLDRLGNQIPWFSGDYPIPASYAPIDDGTMPAPLGLDDAARIAEDEGMLSGYTVYLPENAEDEAGNPLYGVFTVSNSWPRKTSEARDLYLDQFTGETLAEQDVYGYGTIAVGMDTLVSTHMGTQLGLFTRVVMTAVSLLAIWAVISGFVMFWKRRRPGTLGLPRRPADVHLSRRIALVAVVLGLVYPVWGVTALLVLGLDRFVIRKVPALRHTFGQA